MNRDEIARLARAVVEGDDRQSGAEALEGAMLASGRDETDLADLMFAFSMYAPGAGRPYVTWAELCDRILESGALAGPEVKNETRVHLWSQENLGRSVEPLTSAAGAIAGFAARCCAIGLTAGADDEVCVYAPFGVGDAVGMARRRNPRVQLREVFEAKVAKYQATWPKLQVAPRGSR